MPSARANRRLFLEDEALATAEETAKGGQEEPEEFDHPGRIADRCPSPVRSADFCPPTGLVVLGLGSVYDGHGPTSLGRHGPVWFSSLTPVSPESFEFLGRI